MFCDQPSRNLLEATYELSNLYVEQSESSFKKAILRILAHYFQYKHTLFWDMTEGELHEAPMCLNVDLSTLQDYLTYYKQYDPLHPKFMSMNTPIQRLAESTAVSVQQKQQYIQAFLTPQEYRDEMVLYLAEKGQPTMVIGFLRAIGEPVFTKQDCQQLAALKRTIEHMMVLNRYMQPISHLAVTEREKELLVHLCKGSKNAEIAQALFVSENTVKKHLQNLYRKFDVTTRTQLVMKYLERSTMKST